MISAPSRSEPSKWSRYAVSEMLIRIRKLMYLSRAAVALEVAPHGG